MCVTLTVLISVAHMCRVDRLEADVRTMTASNNLLQVDTKRRQEFVEQTKTALHQYEMENDRLDSVSMVYRK